MTVVASDSREKKKATEAAFPSMGRRFKCVNRTVRVQHTALGAYVTVCLCVSVTAVSKLAANVTAHELLHLSKLKSGVFADGRWCWGTYSMDSTSCGASRERQPRAALLSLGTFLSKTGGRRRLSKLTLT